MLPVPVFQPTPTTEMPQFNAIPTIPMPELDDDRIPPFPQKCFRLIGPKPILFGWERDFSENEIARIRTIIHDLRAAPSFRRQVDLLCAIRIHQRGITRIFGCSISSVQYQIAALGRLFTPPPGRPKLVDAATKDALFRFVNESLDQGLPATVEDVRKFLEDQFDLIVVPDSLRHWIRRQPDLVLKEVAPMEAARCSVQDQDISEYYQRLRALIQDVPADLVCNFDESGFDAFADAQSIHVIAPVGREKEAAAYPVRRNEKRVTLLACISASGRALRPLVIVGRKTIDQELAELGYTPDRVMYRHSPTGYMTQPIFIEWLSEVFIPYINERRIYYGTESLGYAIADNCTAHEGPEVETLCVENGIYPVPLVSHSSHQTQMLDLGVFGPVKAAQSRVSLPVGLSTQSAQVARMLSAWESQTYPTAVISAWRQAGVNVCFDPNAGYLRIDVDGVARKVDHAVSQQSDRVQLGKTHISIQGLRPLAPVGPARFTIPNDLCASMDKYIEDRVKYLQTEKGIQDARTMVQERLNEFQSVPPAENPGYQSLVDLIPESDCDSDDDFVDSLEEEPDETGAKRRNAWRPCRGPRPCVIRLRIPAHMRDPNTDIN